MAKHKHQPTDFGMRTLLDVPVTLTVEVGQVRLAVEDILKLGAGSIVELEARGKEPVNILLNGTLIGEGEIVELPSGRKGVRILEVIDRQVRRARQTRGAA